MAKGAGVFCWKCLHFFFTNIFGTIPCPKCGEILSVREEEYWPTKKEKK